MTEADQIEPLIRAASDARNYERAATLTIEYYGPELLGFLTSHLHDDEAASEVFADFSEGLWKALPAFEWRCSMRTFAYKLARRTAGHYQKGARHRDRLQLRAELSELPGAVERLRTATAAYKRTDVQARFQELRAQLPEEDQMLLVLRVDRGLSWLELAEVALVDELTPSPTRLRSEAARLRKRFQIAKERLRGLIEEAGLLDPQ